MADTVLIWSGEHRAYWRPNRSGYTEHVHEAGRYTPVEAERLAQGCGPEKRIELRDVPTAVIRMLTYEPVVLTTEEYEALYREVFGRIVADPGNVSDRILAKLLTEHEGRYHEAKTQNCPGWDLHGGVVHDARCCGEGDATQC